MLAPLLDNPLPAVPEPLRLEPVAPDLDLATPGSTLDGADLLAELPANLREELLVLVRAWEQLPQASRQRMLDHALELTDR